MTANQQFVLALIAALAGILIPAFKVMLNKLAEIKREVANQLTIIDGKIYKVGENVDGKMEKLLLAIAAQKHAEGKLEEAQEERDRKLTATALLIAPVVSSPETAAALLDKTTIIADNTTKLAESIEAKEDGTPTEGRNPFLPPDRHGEEPRR